MNKKNTVPIKTRNVKELCMSEYKNRSCPNFLVRCAVFGIRSSSKKVYLDEMSLPCLTDHNLVYSGLQLNQSDFDVFQIIGELWTEQGRERYIMCSKYKLLGLLDKTDCKDNYEALKHSLERLKTCIFKMQSENYYFCKGFINGVEADEKTGEFRIEVDRNFIQLFDADKLSYQNFAIRSSLKGELTKWLYNFYSSQQDPQKHRISFLKELCGSESEFKKFKFSLKASLMQLQEKGGIERFEIFPNDVVQIFPVKGKKKISSTPVARELPSSPIVEEDKCEQEFTGRGRVAL